MDFVLMPLSGIFLEFSFGWKSPTPTPTPKKKFSKEIQKWGDFLKEE